jgi:serine/threonine protein kinase
MAAAVGRVVGNWILRSVIGRGGMSEVFAGEHRERGDAAAIKVLRPQLAADEAQAVRFADEAARTRAVEHPNVVRVLDFGRDDDGTLYLVMERLAGEDLAARLRRVGRLDEAEVRRLGAAVADGMQAAHARGIIHRDLKPANILILADGQPKIVDFGIAKLLATDAAATGPGMGTPHYMAPEQLTEGAVAPGIDIWALGVTLFEAATGSLPFTGFSDGRCPQLVDAPPRPGERAPLSAGLEALILQCLQRSAAQRPATMREVAERLRQEDAALERATIPLTPPARPAAASDASPPSSPSPAGRRWSVRIATAAVVLAGASLAMWRAERPAAIATPTTIATTPASPSPSPSPPPSPAPATPAAPPTVTPAPPAPAPIADRAHPRRRHHAAPHKLRSRIYGEKLD